jgi:hypothetical protein
MRRWFAFSLDSDPDQCEITFSFTTPNGVSAGGALTLTAVPAEALAILTEEVSNA